MNIIFVDIDGPLMSRKMHMFHQNRKVGQEKAMPRFDEFSVRAFNLWAKYGNAKIVFSTAWAWNWEVDELKEVMKHNGLGFEYHDDVLTPKKMSSSRLNEVVWWIHKHLGEGDQYIIVDDDTSCQDLNFHLDRECKATGEWIRVDFDNGLSWDNFLDGCTALGIDIDDIYQDEFGIPKLTDEEKARRHSFVKNLL
jgi:hypothetical protein